MVETVWVAEYHSEHFTFRAVGHTADEAKKSLERGLKRHGRARGLPDPHTWFEPEDYLVHEIEFGGCLRDDTEI